jgi:hypothetical protein
MSEPENKTNEQYYEIIIQGLLDDRWMRWFDGMQRDELPGGRTRLGGFPADPSALYGMLSRIRDLGFPLLLVRRGDIEINIGELIKIFPNQIEEI